MVICQYYYLWCVFVVTIVLVPRNQYFGLIGTYRLEIDFRMTIGLYLGYVFCRGLIGRAFRLESLSALELVISEGEVGIASRCTSPIVLSIASPSPCIV